MKRTAQSILNHMTQTKLLMNPTHTHEELCEQLPQFQELILKLVFNDDHAEGLNLTDVITHFENIAKERQLENHPMILNAIANLREFKKELSVIVSGIKAEEAVRRELHKCSRDFYQLENIYLKDEYEKTEIDQLLFTSTGIVIIEVKNPGHHVFISESGRMCRQMKDDKKQVDCIGEQMNTKRYLVRTKLENAMKQAGIRKKLPIRTLIVFTNPYIRVDDFYEREEWCYCADLPHIIEELYSKTHFSDEEMQKLCELMRSQLAESEAFENKVDYDQVRTSFASALELLEQEPIEENVKMTDTSQTEAKAEIPQTPVKSKAFPVRKALKMASVFAGAMMVGAGLHSLYQKYR